MEQKFFDNINDIACDDIAETLKKGSKVSIAAACFSMYAYKELKSQLENIEECKFIFTSPTFVKEKESKQKREFYIPRLSRETSLYGTEFEIKLRNEMTQKSIAKECANWIKKKVTFKSNVSGGNLPGFLNIEFNAQLSTYTPISGFSTVDLGCEKGNNICNFITKYSAPISNNYLNIFNKLWNDKESLQDVTDAVIENITTAYNENSPEFIYFLILYNVFSEFLNDISEDELPNEATGFKNSKIWNLLYDFQKDAVLAIINKLERYNGCILADSVGLGKTYTSLAVIKYYENRNKSVLVLCPKKLMDNWNTFKDNYVNNPIAIDRLNYDVLFHTDLSRTKGLSNGLDLGRLNWGNYDLVVIDESHNFRNGLGTNSNNVENRYKRLMSKIIQSGVKTKVLMLSATPVNNRFLDLKNQLEIAYEGDPSIINKKLETKKNIDEIFRQAQRSFNKWNNLEPEERTTKVLLNLLDFDFFKLLDSVTIARSRKHIEKYYNIKDIGKFPTRNKPISIRAKLTDLNSAITFNEIYEELSMLNLSIYTPSKYIFKSKLEKYLDSSNTSESKSFYLSQNGREEGIRKLMRINLLKRLESSVNSFYLTLKRINDFVHSTLKSIDAFEANQGSNSSSTYFTDYEISEDDQEQFDFDDSNSDFFTVGKTIKIDLADMDYKSWRDELLDDADVLDLLLLMVKDITPEYDSKLNQLIEIIFDKINNPINSNNKKIIVFSAFADTALYLYDNVSSIIKNKFGLNTAVITGTIEGKTTVKGFKASFNNVLTCFSPISKDRNLLKQNENVDIDVLIATDCISEGQNLQDCDYLINYDIHWNPVRIIQRFGRIDRIGSKNNCIQLVNFWPDIDLDEYINLKGRVEARMKVSVMTSTGDDDPINQEEKGDLEYRREQLKRLHEEVVDIEDMSTGISIMDLGLNEFRLDLLDYVKNNGDMDKFPKGMHAVVESTKELPPGCIFVLKNINSNVNIDNKNRIHPFYMVYIGDDSQVICDYLNPKKLLDDIRLLCRGKKIPNKNLCAVFNDETEDGRNMKRLSGLLSDSINSIIKVKDESDIDSLFTSGGTSALLSTVEGLKDFELICFLVVKNNI